MTSINSFTPFNPQFPSYMMRNDLFSNMIETNGINITWKKSHQCACMYGSSVPGSPDPRCATCSGRGIYWDSPGIPFVGLITFLHGRGSSPNEPGTRMSTDQGLIQFGVPLLSIPTTATNVYGNASIYDAFVEENVTQRFTTALTVGETTALPYQDNIYVEPTGAVSIWDTTTKQNTFVDTYSVSGNSVILDGYPNGTYYTVEFTASPVYIAFKKSGGLVHQRPFGNNQFPERFVLEYLDLFIRSNTNSSTNSLP